MEYPHFHKEISPFSIGHTMKYIFIQGPCSNAMLVYRSVALVLKIETRFSRIRNPEGQINPHARIISTIKMA